jgi:hypothetical protein
MVPAALEACLPKRYKNKTKYGGPGVMILEADLCGQRPTPPKPPAHGENQTGIDYKLNQSMVTKLLGGSWFSTTTAGQCNGTAMPGGSSGCTWRVAGSSTRDAGGTAGAGGGPLRVKSYTCTQQRIARAVMAVNPSCFRTCSDGTDEDPAPPGPSDCWTEVSGHLSGTRHGPIHTR